MHWVAIAGMPHRGWTWEAGIDYMARLTGACVAPHPSGAPMELPATPAAAAGKPAPGQKMQRGTGVVDHPSARDVFDQPFGTEQRGFVGEHQVLGNRPVGRQRGRVGGGVGFPRRN